MVRTILLRAAGIVGRICAEVGTSGDASTAAERQEAKRDSSVRHTDLRMTGVVRVGARPARWK